MNAIVEGVTIELTVEQECLIIAARKGRPEYIDSFAKILLHFGFKKIDTIDWAAKDAIVYQHKERNWHAEIYPEPSGYVWLVGNGLRNNVYPGGHCYWTPKEIETEIIKALTKTNL